MTEPVFDVRSAVRAIARRRIVVAGLVLEGIAGAVIFVVLQTPSFVAHSRVVLPPAPGMDESGAPLRDIGTELFVATNEEILERAGQVVRPPLGVGELRRRVRTRAASSDVIEIRTEAGSSDEAALLADAVANEYVAYSNSARSAEAEATISELEKQAAQLEERIRDLETRISDATAGAARLDPNSPEAARAGVLIATLRSEQVDGEQRLNAVNTRIDDIHLNALLTRRGARVLEKASPPSGPASPRPVRDVAAGGLVGLLAGVVLALAVDQRDRTLRLRRDIAEAVRAPVLASLRVPRLRRNACKALLKQWIPGAVETRVLEQAIAYVRTANGQPPANLAVASLAGDRRASLVSLQLAVVSAASGTRAAVVIDEAVTTHLGSSCDRMIRRKREVRPRLRVLRSSPAQSPDPKPGELMVVPVAVTVAVDENIPVQFPAFLAGAPVVLAVSSGFATAEKLAAAAIACVDAGHTLVGVIVANPERGDRTSGRPSRGAVGITDNGAGAARTAWQPHPPPSLKTGGRWG